MLAATITQAIQDHHAPQSICPRHVTKTTCTQLQNGANGHVPDKHVAMTTQEAGSVNGGTVPEVNDNHVSLTVSNGDPSVNGKVCAVTLTHFQPISEQKVNGAAVDSNNVNNSNSNAKLSSSAGSKISLKGQLELC